MLRVRGVRGGERRALEQRSRHLTAPLPLQQSHRRRRVFPRQPNPAPTVHYQYPIRPGVWMINHGGFRLYLASRWGAPPPHQPPFLVHPRPHLLIHSASWLVRDFLSSSTSPCNLPDARAPQRTAGQTCLIIKHRHAGHKEQSWGFQLVIKR